MPANSRRVDCWAECITAAELCKALVFYRAPVFQTRDFVDSLIDRQFNLRHRQTSSGSVVFYRFRCRTGFQRAIAFEDHPAFVKSRQAGGLPDFTKEKSAA